MSKVKINIRHILRDVFNEIFEKLSVPVTDEITNKLLREFGTNIVEIQYDDEYYLKIKHTCGKKVFIDFTPVLNMKNNNIRTEDFIVFYSESYFNEYDFDSYTTNVFIIDFNRNDVIEIVSSSNYFSKDYGEEKVFDTTFNNEVYKFLYECISRRLEKKVPIEQINNMMDSIIMEVIYQKDYGENYIYSIKCGDYYGIHIKFDEEGTRTGTIRFSDVFGVGYKSYIVVSMTGVLFQNKYGSMIFLIDVDTGKVVLISSS